MLLSLCTSVGMAVILLFLVLLANLIFADSDLSLTFKTKCGKGISSLAGKVVWITGASSGIGEYMAYCLAEAGCKLVLSARRKEELERVKEACLDKGKGKITGDDILVVPLDVVAYETHKPAVQQVLKYFNKIDVLVNNAGRFLKSTWMECELSVEKSLFETYVLGSVSLTQEVLPHMIERNQGQIAVMSSIAGKCGAPFSPGYIGCKHALHGYFECLRTEVGSQGIDITMICPGLTHSHLLQNGTTSNPEETLGLSLPDNSSVMTTERCAYLACVAIANKSYEVWISKQPTLTTFYIACYLPELSRWVWKNYGVAIMNKFVFPKS